MKLCSGCQTKLPDDWRGKCAECKAERTPSDDSKQHAPGGIYDATLDHLNKGARWQRRRARVIHKQPMCARCDVALAEIVDHIVPAAVAVQQTKDSGQYPFDPNAGYYLITNLQGMCRSCHAIKTAEDKAHLGPWPNVVEKEAAAPKKVWSF